ncbi:DUF1508 domain-containing protein [Spirillospora sp. CA-255316]
MRFQIYRSSDAAFYWRMLSRNHRIVAIAAEGFASTEEVAEAAGAVRAHAATAVIDLTSVQGGEWTWTMRLDGRPVAVSAHGYGRRLEAQAAAQRFRAGARDAVVVDKVIQIGHGGGSLAAERSHSTGVRRDWTGRDWTREGTA